MAFRRLKNGTQVLIRNYDPRMNGVGGFIKGWTGDFYEVAIGPNGRQSLYLLPSEVERV